MSESGELNALEAEEGFERRQNVENGAAKDIGDQPAVRTRSASEGAAIDDAHFNYLEKDEEVQPKTVVQPRLVFNEARRSMHEQGHRVILMCTMS